MILYLLQALLCCGTAALLYFGPEPHWLAVPLAAMLLAIAIDTGVMLRDALQWKLQDIMARRLDNLADGNRLVMATMTRRDLMAAGVPEEKLPEDDSELLEKASELYDTYAKDNS